jgi:L-iditol 2-dehydrogenase
MKALTLTAYNHFEFGDVPEPKTGPDEVLIHVAACGICGSDIHGMDGSTGRRIPPVIMGHEAGGTIVQVGTDVDGWHVGDRVTFDSTIYCGKCYFCRRGEINLCDRRRVLGVSCADYRQNGAFAEYVAVPQHILYRLPADLTFVRAAMAEPVSVAVHAVERTPLALACTAAVVGAGMIGLLVIQALKARGVGRVIAVDLDAGRLEKACLLGADVALKSDAVDAAVEILKLTDGRGADAAFEVVGITPTIRVATQCVRKGGSLTLVGNLSPTSELLLQAVVTRELTLYGSCASRGEYPVCLDLITRGQINVDALISATAPLGEGDAWFQRLHQGAPGMMKVILEP